MAALVFVVDTLLTLLVFTFLLRFLLQLVRADYRNPLVNTIVRLTQWAVAPLRRVLPPIGRLDTATLVTLLAAQLVATGTMFWMLTGVASPFGPLLLATLRELLVSTLQLYTFAVFIYALLSFIAPGTHSPAAGLLAALCEPLLRPVRRILPAAAGLDFSPLVVIIGLQALRILVA